jgi:DNA-nicking Smr family endonuclease
MSRKSPQNPPPKRARSFAEIKDVMAFHRRHQEVAKVVSPHKKATATAMTSSVSVKKNQAHHKPTHAPGKPEIDFVKTMRDNHVIPLPTSQRHRVSLRLRQTPPIPRQRLADEREVLRLAKFGEESVSFAADEFVARKLTNADYDLGQEWDDDQTYLRHGVSPDALRKLRRGFWAIQSEIDLHGLNTHEAHDAVLDFLIEARQRGLRCVRIVHGKGLSSPNKLPILKGKVRRWLATWNDVLAYCEPHTFGGGGGAVLVLLRGR